MSRSEPTQVPENPRRLPALVFLSEPQGATSAAVFVHGLGGTLFGTWGPKGDAAAFPRRLAADLPDTAIATFGYRSGLQRFWRPKKLDMQGLARIWAQTLRDAFFSRYESVHIVCHSLGGILSMLALRHLYTSEPLAKNRLIEGELHLSLFFIGVPQEGTGVGPFGWLSAELRALKYNNALLRDLHAFWKGTIRQPRTDLEPGQIPVSVRAVVSEIDNWVSQTSSAWTLEERDTKAVAMSHTDLVKPPLEGEHETYDFVLSRIRKQRFEWMPKAVASALDLSRAGLDMVLQKVDLDSVVARKWIDQEIDDALASQDSGFVHLRGPAGSGKTSYLARYLVQNELPGFFFDKSLNAIRPADLHVAIWAQLTDRGLLPATKMPEHLGDDPRVLRQILERAASNAGDGVTFIVDALDEAESVVGAPALLPILPTGVIFVTSGRPGGPHPPAARLIDLKPESDESREDVKRLVHRQLSALDFKKLGLSPEWTLNSMTERLSQHSQGLMAIARLLTDDLAAGRLDLQDLATVSKGLEDYFTETFRRLRASHDEKYSNAIRPILLSLSVARSPLSAALLAQRTCLDEGLVLEVLERELAPWLTGSGSPSRFHLNHASLREWFRKRDEAGSAKAEASAAEQCLQFLVDQAGDSGTEPERYALAHGIRHLIDAGRAGEAAQLLLNLTFLDRHRARVGSPAVLSELQLLKEAIEVGELRNQLRWLVKTWSDEGFAIRDTSTLLAQLSYRIGSGEAPQYVLQSQAALARTYTGSWLEVLNRVEPRSTSSITLRGHQDVIQHCRFDSTGTLLFTASGDATIRVWDFESPEQRYKVLEGHQRGVNHFDINADGSKLVTASDDETLRVFSLTSLASAPTILAGHEDWVHHCRFLPGGLSVVSASEDKTLRIWDLSSRHPTAVVLAGHTEGVLHCTVDSVGRRVISASDDGTLRVWNLEVLSEDPEVLEGHLAAVNHCAVDRTGSTLASASDDGTLRIWPLSADHDDRQKLIGHTDRVNFSLFSNDGRYLISASDDHSVRAWDLTSLPDSFVVAEHRGAVHSCVVHRTGNWGASASEDGTVQIWGLTPEADAERHGGFESGVSALALSETRWLAAGSRDRSIRLWDLTSTGNEFRTRKAHDGPINACAFREDSQLLISASDDGRIGLWDTARLESKPLIFDSHAGAVRGCSLRSDGNALATASDDGTVLVWNLKRHSAQPRVLPGHEGAATCCAFEPGTGRLASGGDDGVVRVWDTREPAAEPAVMVGHARRVRHCAFHPGGGLLASASDDGTVHVWNLENGGSIRAVLTGHDDWVRHCAFDPLGQFIATASDDGSIQIFDLATPQSSIRLEGHHDGVNHCALTSDGRILISASRDHTLRVWNLDNSEALSLKGHEASVSYCAVSPDDVHGASASEDGSVRVWPLNGGGPPAILRVVSAATWVGWLRDGRLAASDSSGRVWFLAHRGGQWQERPPAKAPWRRATQTEGRSR